MRTPAHAERDLIARLIAWVAFAAAACLLFATLFAGCEGPGLEPPAHDRNSGTPSAGGTVPPPVTTGGSGGSFGNAGGHAGSGTPTGGGGAGGKGSDAGSTPDTTPKPDAGLVPGLDAGRDEDAGVD